MLTSVGGQEGWFRLTDSNKLYSFINRKWVEHFPPMPTKRRHSTTVYKNNILVVAGGFNGRFYDDNVNIVEVLDTEMKQWSSASSLPLSVRVCYQSSAVCDDQVYISTNNTHTLLKCSLTSLVQSKPDSVIWEQTAEIPVTVRGWTANFSPFAVNGHLLAIGGMKTNVHRYDPASNSWDVISHLPDARSRCVTAVLPNKKLLLLGGLARPVIATFN